MVLSREGGPTYYNYGFCLLWSRCLRASGRRGGRRERLGGSGGRGEAVEDVGEAVEEDENVQRMVHIRLAHSRTS